MTMSDPGLARLLGAMDAMAEWAETHHADACGGLTADRAALRRRCLQNRLGAVAERSAYVRALGARATGRVLVG